VRRGAVGVLALALLAAPAAASKPRARHLAPRAFASCPQLIAHARHWQARTGGRVWAPIRGLPVGPMATGPARQGGPSPVAAPQATDTSFSTTNNQEEGVDEPDSVKTDGRRIFAVAGDSLHAVDAATPRLLGSLKLSGGSGYELLPTPASTPARCRPRARPRRASPPGTTPARPGSTRSMCPIRPP